VVGGTRNSEKYNSNCNRSLFICIFNLILDANRIHAILFLLRDYVQPSTPAAKNTESNIYLSLNYTYIEVQQKNVSYPALYSVPVPLFLNKEYFRIIASLFVCIAYVFVLHSERDS
jgi:hypothetical protein